MLSLERRAASDWPTLSPFFRRRWSFWISTWPLLILEGMLSAWRKEVWVGSRPVGPAGTTTSLGARVPTLAGASTRRPTTLFFTVLRSPLVNTKPMLPRTCDINSSRPAGAEFLFLSR
eukprot:Mycagemm_TRINITY_DN10317_c2_g1::TRINITY_DN10317_c2_g1_i2::g.832::m.832 type:complete len:118 gc:universal TRINITY_DN10317_c2_g1_i2:601-248(-)